MACLCVCPHREGIQWEAIDWMDNAECLDLIEKVTDSETMREHSHPQDHPLTTSWSELTQTPHWAYTDSHLPLYHYAVSVSCCLYSNVHRPAVRGMAEIKHDDTLLFYHQSYK